VKRPPLQLPTLRLAAGLLALVLPSTALADGDAAEGKKTYDLRCWECHGATGAGDGPSSTALNPLPRNFTSEKFKFDADKDGVTGTDEDLRIVIEKGGAAFGGNPVMAPWMQLSDQEIANLIAYIRSLRTERTTRR
jgi:mono/diheme cytochrome c family protein